MTSLGQLWDQLVDCICRPPRDSYSVEDLVGGEGGRFHISKFSAKRVDLTLTNKKGLKLQCSHFIPEGVNGLDGKLPCVIYCHCNSGSRRDAEEALYVLIPLGVSVFTLDFAGSGLSDGKYVTLGAHEVDDVEVVVAHLRAAGKTSTLGLWGRSMGAVTALLYSARDPSIAGVVIDSPFSRLTDLMLEIVEDQKLPIPKALTKVALAAMKRSVRKRAEFDIATVSPLEVVPSAFIPALFGHAHQDTFIRIHHSERLHAAYNGDKNFIKFDGDHNSRRPSFFYNSAAIFFHNTLQLDAMIVGGNPLSGEVLRVYGSAVRSGGPAATGATAGDGAAGAPGAAAGANEELGITGHAEHHELGATGVPWRMGSLAEPGGTGLPVSTNASTRAGAGGGVTSSTGGLWGMVDGAAEEGGEYEEDEDPELMAAIQLSLAEAAAAAAAGAVPARAGGTANGAAGAAGVGGAGSRGAEAASAPVGGVAGRASANGTAGPLTQSGPGRATYLGSAPVPGARAPGTIPAPMLPLSYGSGGGAVAAALAPAPAAPVPPPPRLSSSAAAPSATARAPSATGRSVAAAPPVLLVPSSLEDEEAMLQAALALSLQEAPAAAPPPAAATAPSTAQGPTASADAARPVGQAAVSGPTPPQVPQVQPQTQRSTNYVDLLCDELGEALSSPSK